MTTDLRLSEEDAREMLAKAVEDMKRKFDLGDTDDMVYANASVTSAKCATAAIESAYAIRAEGYG